MAELFDPSLTDDQIANRLQTRLEHLYEFSKSLSSQGYRNADDVLSALKHSGNIPSRLPTCLKTFFGLARGIDADIEFFFDSSVPEELEHLVKRCEKGVEYVRLFAGNDKIFIDQEHNESSTYIEPYTNMSNLRGKIDSILPVMKGSLALAFTQKDFGSGVGKVKCALLPENDDFFFEYSPRPLRVVLVESRKNDGRWIVDVNASAVASAYEWRRNLSREASASVIPLVSELLFYEISVEPIELLQYWFQQHHKKITP